MRNRSYHDATNAMAAEKKKNFRWNLEKTLRKSFKKAVKNLKKKDVANVPWEQMRNKCTVQRSYT